MTILGVPQVGYGDPVVVGEVVGQAPFLGQDADAVIDAFSAVVSSGNEYATVCLRGYLQDQRDALRAGDHRIAALDSRFFGHVVARTPSRLWREVVRKVEAVYLPPNILTPAVVLSDRQVKAIRSSRVQEVRENLESIRFVRSAAQKRRERLDRILTQFADKIHDSTDPNVIRVWIETVSGVESYVRSVPARFIATDVFLWSRFQALRAQANP
ncbi:MAG: hypothetical protein Q7T03_07930 [Deltaproteobacteria bacterium]|nr:hypothetical protein [Deltaproteobacteria bacterium]